MKFLLSNKLYGVSALAVAAILAGPLAQGSSAHRPELRSSFRQEILRLINKERISHGLTPVALDPATSEFADRYCELQIRNKTTGHFTTDGLTPYMRYSFAGGNDGVTENAAAWSANYSFADSSILDMIRRSHEAMVTEVPPHDGHRRALLDPDATHVGIGLAWEKGEFRFVQEFVRKYIDWQKPAPREATLSERASVEGRARPGYRVVAASLYYEEHPEPMSAFVASRIATYGLPKERRDFSPSNGVVRQVRRRTKALADVAGGGSGALEVRTDGSFTFSAPFSNGAGVYTVVIWVARAGDDRPISASNMSIRVSGGGGRSLGLLSR